MQRPPGVEGAKEEPAARQSIGQLMLRAILGALTFAPCLAIAGPIEASVWIDVSREDGANESVLEA